MTPLRLAALDAEDLAILSSHSQDAVIKVGDISWLRSENRLIIAMHRFAWEQALAQKKGLFAPKPTYERRQSVLHFDQVSSVQARNIKMQAQDAVLNLLAIAFEQEGDGPNGVVRLIFAGDAELRLQVECIESQLTDAGSAWETENLPEHDAAETFEALLKSRS
ncbi:MAG: DUF2948 family protein [Cohaesibacter sp.]|nr:DUF2948 family protein [Cohaesibacter sp.]